MQTTVAHIVSERLKNSGIYINFPPKYQGDLMMEHAWAVFDPTGPQLRKNFPELWENVCKEIDYAISEGAAVFNDGIITINS